MTDLKSPLLQTAINESKLGGSLAMASNLWRSIGTEVQQTNFYESGSIQLSIQNYDLELAPKVMGSYHLYC